MKFHCGDHPIKRHHHDHQPARLYHIAEQGDHSYAVSFQFTLNRKEEEAERRLRVFCDRIAAGTEEAGGLVGHIKMICCSEKEKKISFTDHEIETELIGEGTTKVKGVAILLLPQKDVLAQIMDHAVSMIS